MATPPDILTGSIRGKILAKSTINQTVFQFMAFCPLCICFWLPAQSSKKKANEALDIGNYQEFQIHSRSILSSIRNGYMTGFCIMMIPVVCYFIIIFGAIFMGFGGP